MEFDKINSNSTQRMLLPIATVLDNCTKGDVRLGESGVNESVGRVEICFNQRWGMVCDDLWDDTDAQVVCKQLGLPFAGIMTLMHL